MWADDEISNLVVGVSSCKDEFWTYCSTIRPWRMHRSTTGSSGFF